MHVLVFGGSRNIGYFTTLRLLSEPVSLPTSLGRMNLVVCPMTNSDGVRRSRTFRDALVAERERFR